MPVWNDGIAKIVLPTPFPVGDVNAYVVKGERLTLIDVGPKTKEAYDSLSKQLNEIGISVNDIEQVVLTHHHPDHAGLLDLLSPNLEVYGHPLNERWINLSETFFEEHDQFYQQLFLEVGLPKEYLRLMGALKKTLKFSCNRSLTKSIVEGESPLGLSEWKVIETPGHAQSHIGLFREKDGVFIGGDHLLAHISPNPLIEPPLPGTKERPKSILQYNDSLKKLLQYPIKLVYSGHGEEITDVPQLIELRLQQQHNRAMGVLKMLEEETLTVFEICQRIFPKVYERELSLTISETLAQIDYLLSIEQIVFSKENGVLRYRAK